MSWVILIVSAVLAGIAAAGVLWPYTRSSRVRLERLADPLEDERSSLLRAIRELDEEHAEGMLSEADYRSLRAETEQRAVAVLRAMDARDGVDELASGIRELRATAPPGNAGRAKDRVLSRVLPWLLGAVVLAALVIPLMSRALRTREEEAPITGSIPGEAVSDLAFFEERVREHPGDVAARLDLAQRYRDSGNTDGAIEQYLAALDIDPDNAEAQANLGFLLHVAGRAEEGLEAVDRALEEDPDYPDALYFRGIILLEGLDRPDEAAQAFRQYLDSAPFGSRRSEVESLLEDLE